jgi:hypothetical protein
MSLYGLTKGLRLSMLLSILRRITSHILLSVRSQHLFSNPCVRASAIVGCYEVGLIKEHVRGSWRSGLSGVQPKSCEPIYISSRGTKSDAKPSRLLGVAIGFSLLFSFLFLLSDAQLSINVVAGLSLFHLAHSFQSLLFERYFSLNS